MNKDLELSILSLVWEKSKADLRLPLRPNVFTMITRYYPNLDPDDVSAAIQSLLDQGHLNDVGPESHSGWPKVSRLQITDSGLGIVRAENRNQVRTRLDTTDYRHRSTHSSLEETLTMLASALTVIDGLRKDYTSLKGAATKLEHHTSEYL